MPLPPTLLLVAYARSHLSKCYVYLSTCGTRLCHTLQQVYRWPHSCRYRRLIDLLQKREYWYPPCSSGFTVRTGDMLKIAILRIGIFLRLFSFCLRTGSRLLKKQLLESGPLSRFFFQLLPTNGLHAAQTFRNIGAFPHFVCIAVQEPTLPKRLNMSVRPPPIFFAFPYAQTPC